MNFIITYDISDSKKRAEFEKEIDVKFPNSAKETTNQTTVIGDSNKTLVNTVEIIEGILQNITTSPNDTVTIYYPVLINKVAVIEKKEILKSQIKESLANEIRKMKYLMDYTRFSD